MPTARPRHMITETDEIARAIDAAALRWPQAAGNRAELVRLILIEYGGAAERESENRRAIIRELAGKYTGMYPPDWREQSRREWPE